MIRFVNKSLRALRHSPLDNSTRNKLGKRLRILIKIQTFLYYIRSSRIQKTWERKITKALVMKLTF